MKTSEFIEYFKNEGLRVFNFEDGRIVVQNNYSNTLISLTDREFVVAVGYFPFDKQQEYYKVIFEYLMTPPEEREEEKRYYLRQIGINEYDNFLNLEYETQSYYVSSSEEFYDYKTQ